MHLPVMFFATIMDCLRNCFTICFSRLSPVTLASVPPAAIQPVASKDESREFMAIFPDLVRDLTEAGRHLDIPEVTKWLSKVCISLLF